MSNDKQARVTASIVASVHEAEAMFFRESAGEAKSELGTFELSTVVGTRAPIIRLPDGRWIRFEWDALVTAAVQAGQKQDIKAKGFRK